MPVTNPPVANAIRLTSVPGNPPLIVITFPPRAGGTVTDGVTSIDVTVATNDLAANLYLEVFDEDGVKIGLTETLPRDDSTPNIVSATITLTSPFTFITGQKYSVRCYAMIDGEITEAITTVTGVNP